MKLTDLALIFIGIFLPIVVIVYINTSFVVKAEKQEMYYKNLMNSAISDAVSQMKQVENSDIDYGYSGIVDKKVSINPEIALSTFYNSLSTNFNIKDNEMSLERLKMYIPVIAIMDYDGIYIHSAEQDVNGEISFVTKPKVNYTYSYIIKKDEKAQDKSEHVIVDLEKIDNLRDLISTDAILGNHIYEITFTMDDYVYLNIYNIEDAKIGGIVYSKNFYLEDYDNNEALVYAKNILSTQKNTLRKTIVESLKDIRKRVIAEKGMEEVSYAVNKHNTYARQAGITYNFIFTVESDATWYDTMDGIGMIAIIQGISLGNRYLNYKAYSAADLVTATKYYVSNAFTTTDKEGKVTTYSYLSRNLYHSTSDCPAYKSYLNTAIEKPVPSFFSTKKEAATHGYYPCPICKP